MNKNEDYIRKAIKKEFDKISDKNLTNPTKFYVITGDNSKRLKSKNN